MKVGTTEACFKRLLSRALPLYAVGPLLVLAACGGSSASNPAGDTDGSPSGGRDAQGEAGASVVGSEAGKPGAGDAGHGAVGGSSAGSGGAAGSVAGGAAGSGASAGAGATAGFGATGGGGQGGAGGISGESGAGGMGLAGSTSEVCHAPPPQVCAGGLITLPKSCVDQASAVAGTTLPSKQCLTMCESVIGSCSVQAVQQATITIACVTGCPTRQP